MQAILVLDYGKLISDEKKRIHQGFFPAKIKSDQGSLPSLTCMFNVNKAGHANMGRVDDCFQGEKTLIPRDRGTEDAAVCTPEEISTT